MAEMNDSHSNRIGAGGNWIAYALAGLVTLLGALVIVGWYFKNRTLLQIHPSFVPKQYNAALGFLLCGGGLLLWEFGQVRATLIAGGMVAAIGLLTVIEYVAGVNLGIDELLMKHDITVETSHPGRMGPNSALCFFLSGIGLLVSQLRTMQGRQGMYMVVFGALVTGLGACDLQAYSRTTRRHHFRRWAPRQGCDFFHNVATQLKESVKDPCLK